MSKLKENKAFQTIVGGAVLYLLFILWRDGWIDAILRRNEDPEGFEGPEVWIAVGQALLSFVQLVGIVTIGIVSGVLPHLESMLEFLGKQIKSLLEQAKVFVAKNKDAEPGEQWNWKPLAAIILSITNEEVIPEGKPKAVAFLLTTTASQNQLDLAYSQKLDQFFESKKIERRTISTEQEVTQAEPWLQEIVSSNNAEESSLALYYGNGRIEYVSIPDSISSAQRMFK
jgi:hypothetical protein